MAEETFNSEEAKKFSESLGGAGQELNKINNLFESIARKNKMLGQNFNVFSDAAKESADFLKDNADALDKIEKGQLNLNDAQKIQNQLKEKSANLEKKADNMAKQLLGKKSKLTKEEKHAVNARIAAIRKAAMVQNKEMDSAVKKAAKGETFLAKGFDKLGGKLKSLGMDDAAKSVGKIGQGVRKTAVAGGGMFKQLMKSVGAMKMLKMLNPFALLVSAVTFIVKTLLEINQQTTELGRSLGVSQERAGQIRMHFQNVANATKMAGIEVGEVLKQQGALNEALGLSVTMISGDLIGGMAILAERAKLSQEAVTGFGLAALASQKSVEGVSDEVMKGVLAMNKQLGVNVDMNTVLESTGKTTGEVRAMFFDNFELMGKTVARAQALGRTMGEIRDQSRGFLDFQSSISKEFEAELFLGKQLNLDRARLAAMTGDLATFQEEVVQQAGDFESFSKMSVFQRMKLADALNMNVDALSDMLLMQQNLDELEGSVEARTLEQAKQRQRQLSVQEAFNAAIKRLKNMVINLVARMENASIFGFNLGDLTQVADETIGELTGKPIDVPGANIAGTASSPELAVEDFTIKTHPKDTLVMAGGTQLGGNSGISEDHIRELIEATRSTRTFEYSGFAAVKEAGHYGTKFS